MPKKRKSPSSPRAHKHSTKRKRDERSEPGKDQPARRPTTLTESTEGILTESKEGILTESKEGIDQTPRRPTTLTESKEGKAKPSLDLQEDLTKNEREGLAKLNLKIGRHIRWACEDYCHGIIDVVGPTRDLREFKDDFFRRCVIPAWSAKKKEVGDERARALAEVLRLEKELEDARKYLESL